MADERITLTTLRKQLARKANITEQEAGNFLTQMFDSIVTGLKEDGQVKINGLGTFRLQWNAPRKSVNVQTGEEILIEGYKKVVFTPENALKERINEPFAHLETLVIDGEGNMVEPITAIDPLQKLGEQAEEIKDLLADLADDEPTEAVTTDEKEEEVVSIEEKAEEAVAAEEPTEKPVTTDEKEEGHDSIGKNTAKTKVERPFHPWLVAGISVLIFCLLLVAGYFFLQHKLVSLADSLLNKEVATNVIEEGALTEQEAATDTVIAEPVDTTLIEVAPKEEPLVFKEFITTETITNGSRLSWLSRKYYGTPYFWVYIYIANQDKLPNPNVIPQGTKIRVPKLPKTIGNAQDEEHIAKAQALEQQILGKQ